MSPQSATYDLFVLEILLDSLQHADASFEAVAGVRNKTLGKVAFAYSTVLLIIAIELQRTQRSK